MQEAVAKTLRKRNERHHQPIESQEQVVCTLSRHIRIKSWKFSDHLSQSESRGASSRLMRKITRIGCTVHRGGIVSAISIAEIPRAQMSTCAPLDR